MKCWLLLDVDEYFVPMGNYTSMKDVLRDAAAGGTNILSFRSSRGYLREDRSQDVDKKRIKRPNTTYLETYNCDVSSFPKPEKFDRARKQIYRSDYVLYRFVHYSLVTQPMIKTFNETPANQWNIRYNEPSPSERTTNEATEAVMVHTKVIDASETRNYLDRCRYGDQQQVICMVGYPWPESKAAGSITHEHDARGMGYNCYINKRVEEYWAPRLRAALAQRQASSVAL
jgi:predicted membrane-bound mannosyltransferase